MSKKWRMGRKGRGSTPRKPILFNSGLQTTVVPTLAKGSGTATFTRATTATVEDFEGLIKPVLSGEARFKGARRVENLVATSDVENAAWAAGNAAVTTGIDDPLGGTTAIRATSTGGAGRTFIDIGAGITIGEDIIGSMWIRRSAGTGAINIYRGIDGGNVSAPITPTAEWKRYSSYNVGSLTVTSATPVFGLKINVENDAVDVWFPQYEYTTGQAITAPSEGVSVGDLSSPYHGAMVDGVQYFDTLNGNTVSSNVVTEATGDPIGATDYFADASGPFGYLAEGQRQNICLQSNDLDTTWAEGTGLIPAVQGAVGPDGRATMWTLQTSNDSNPHWMIQAVTHAAGTYTFSVYAKAGTESWMSISDGNGTSTHAVFYNLTTGVVGTENNGRTGTIESLPNGIYRCTFTVTNPSNFISIGVHTADDQSQTYAAAGTETIIVGSVQDELGTFASTYIPTTTTAVTRNADVLTYPASGNILDAAGTAYAEVSSEWSTTGGADYYALSRDGNGRFIYDNAASNIIRAYDGTAVTQSPAGTSFEGAAQKVASTWGSALTAYSPATLSPDASPAAYDGAMGTGAVAIGIRNDGGGPWYGTIRAVKLYKKELSAAQVAAL